MFNKFQDYVHRYELSKKYKYDLDALLDRADHAASLEDRLQWSIDILQWIRYQVVLKDNAEVAKIRLPSTRIKFLMNVLDRNPKWKRECSLMLRSIIKDIDCLDLFVESGLPTAAGFFTEFRLRMMSKIMLEKPLSDGLGSLFQAMFPYLEDAEWMRSLPPEIVEKFIAFLHFEEPANEASWSYIERDISDALFILVSDVRNIGLSAPMRLRMDFKRIQDLPFFDLTKDTEELLNAYYSDCSKEEYEAARRSYLETISRCFSAFESVYTHLDAHGVSTTVVYFLESAQGKLQRIWDLVSLLSREIIPVQQIQDFLSQLIEDNLRKQSLRDLVSSNFQLISRKIVDRSAEMGEHYISRTRADYWKMFRRAARGGAITAATVIVKLLIGLMTLPSFLGGLMASLNYSFSFLLIQFTGGALATKQPAMTAPALANRLQQVEDGAPVELVVDEITKLFRTQIVGILGNVLLVIPVVTLVNLLVEVVTGRYIVASAEDAFYIFKQTDLFGVTLFYAAFTGVLLWLSSIFAGYMDNWFHLHKMRRVIELNRSLNFVFGKDACKTAASFWEKNISGIAANISLGILLGMAPEVLSFFGLSIQVRHVTLAAGTFALGVLAVGWESLNLWEFYSAIVGIGFIGLTNIGVSFSLAFYIALRARRLRPRRKRDIYLALLSRFCRRPLSFFFPVDEQKPDA